MGQGQSSVSVEMLAGEILAIYRSDSSRAETLIEDHIKERLRGCSLDEMLFFTKRLAGEFQVASTGSREAIAFEQNEFPRFFSLLLGRSISIADLSSADIMERLAQSLNTVFDTLNKTIAIINSTLLGKKGEIETIRHIIGSDLERGGGAQSLQSYLDQIQEAFLVAHRGCQQAAHAEVDKILTALDPARIAAAKGFLKFGPFRKAEDFETYKEKYQIVRDWFDSGRFTEDFLRDFETICGKEYAKQARETPWKK
jgi:hypothetical protein